MPMVFLPPVPGSNETPGPAEADPAPNKLAATPAASNDPTITFFIFLSLFCDLLKLVGPQSDVSFPECAALAGNHAIAMAGLSGAGGHTRLACQPPKIITVWS
jgi:hypothetical protein